MKPRFWGSARSILTAIGYINEAKAIARVRLRVSAPLANILIRLGVSPTHLNVVGLITGILAAFFVARGWLRAAAVFVLFSGLADAMDGVVARARGLDSPFGEFVDSVCDRYVDSSLLLGIAWYFMVTEDEMYVFLAFCSVVGVVVTSYSRARAQSLNLEPGYTGFLGRPERLTLLLISLTYPPSLHVLMWTFAILSNITAVHRIIAYAASTRTGKGSKDGAGGIHPENNGLP